MADDKHYVPGDFYRIDDRTGFKIRASDTRKEWTGLIVGKKYWEPRNAQDFVKGVRDNQTVPDPRPRQTDVFITGTGPAQFIVYQDLENGEQAFEAQTLNEAVTVPLSIYVWRTRIPAPQDYPNGNGNGP